MAELANGVRGEFLLSVGDEKLKLVPTWKAIAEIENATGKSIFRLSRELAQGDLSAQVLAIVVTAFHSASGQKGVKVDVVGEMLVREGLANPEMLATIMEALNHAFNGGVKPGERKATTQSQN